MLKGKICLNGAAVRYVQVGDKIIIMPYCDIKAEEAINNKPKVVFVDEKNKVENIARYEKHGQLSE